MEYLINRSDRKILPLFMGFTLILSSCNLAIASRKTELTSFEQCQGNQNSPENTDGININLKDVKSLYNQTVKKVNSIQRFVTNDQNKITLTSGENITINKNNLNFYLNSNNQTSVNISIPLIGGEPNIDLNHLVCIDNNQLFETNLSYYIDYFYQNIK